MHRIDIEEFLVLLGVPRSELCVRGDWVSCKCVLAQWRHQGGIDSHPSFGVKINDEGESIWSCFGCTDGGSPIPDLFVAIRNCSGSYPREAAEFYSQVEVLENTDQDNEKFPEIVGTMWRDERESLCPVHGDVLSMFPLISPSSRLAAATLKRRGVSLDVALQFGVRVWPAKKSFVFPYTDSLGRVMFLRARRWDQEKVVFAITPEMLDVEGSWSWEDSGSWFGLGLVDPSLPMLVVEGEYDVLRLSELGAINVVGAGGSNPTKAQMSSLSSRTIFLGWDSDESGDKALKKSSEKLKDRAALWVVRWSTVGRKDGGALKSTQELEEVMEEAELV